MIKLYGSLEDAETRIALASALQKPQAWAIYLVKTNAAKRTQAQNRLYQALKRELAQQLGHSVQYWHDYLVERFLGFDEVETDEGYVRQVLCSSSELTVTEFSRFLTACLVFAADKNVEVG